MACFLWFLSFHAKERNKLNEAERLNKKLKFLLQKSCNLNQTKFKKKAISLSKNQESLISNRPARGPSTQQREPVFAEPVKKELAQQTVQYLRKKVESRNRKNGLVLGGVLSLVPFFSRKRKGQIK